MIETSLSPEVLELLDKVRVARQSERFAEAAQLMREARALINASKMKGSDVR